jgi:hypothetical protein
MSQIPFVAQKYNKTTKLQQKVEKKNDFSNHFYGQTFQSELTPEFT